MTLAILEPEHRMFVHKLAQNGPAELCKQVINDFCLLCVDSAVTFFLRLYS